MTRVASAIGRLRHAEPYTEAEDALIRRFVYEGRGDREIAAELNRTRDAVVTRRLQLGLRREKPSAPCFVSHGKRIETDWELLPDGVQARTVSAR